MRYTLFTRLLGLAALALASCTSYRQAARAPHGARHLYHHAQRQHARDRRHARPASIYWN